MPKVTDEQFAKIKAENSGVDLTLLRHEFGDVVVRPASSAVYERFVVEKDEPGKKFWAMRFIVFSCVVFPLEGDLTKLLDERPGLVHTFGNDCLEISGLKAVSDRKK